MTSLTPTPSFSRSGRSSVGGKQTERISTDVSEALLCDLADAQELFREHAPTATRAEVVRMILEEDLQGCIASLTRAFPAAKHMGLEALEKTLATLAGKSLEQYRQFVMAKHIFGRLHAVEESMGVMPDLGQSRNAAEGGQIQDQIGRLK